MAKSNQVPTTKFQYIPKAYKNKAHSAPNQSLLVFWVFLLAVSLFMCMCEDNESSPIMLVFSLSYIFSTVLMTV